MSHEWIRYAYYFTTFTICKTSDHFSISIHKTTNFPSGSSPLSSATFLLIKSINMASLTVNLTISILYVRRPRLHGVDLQQFDIKNNELLFILPHQIHELPSTKQGTDYFKMGLDENCLSFLPKNIHFLSTLSISKKLNSLHPLLQD